MCLLYYKTHKKSNGTGFCAVFLCMHGADVDECTNNIQEYTVITQDKLLRAELSLGGNLEHELKTK